MPTAYLNIGSNQGDRHATIERAVALIAQAYPDATLRRSSYYTSRPWGYDSDNEYVNLGVALDMDRTPDALALLVTLQGIERAISPQPHRNADGSYRDRDIDIDIIAVEGVRMHTPHLTLPHPRARQREFVMVPLAQLCESPEALTASE